MEKSKLLEGRKIGSSDAPIIMGVSPWETPYKLWERKIRNIELPSNPAMQYGNEMEPIARKWASEKLGVNLYESKEVHKNYHWMTANLDAVDMDKDIVVEIKCPYSRKLYDTIPEHYLPQLQHQIEVMGIDGMYFISFDGYEGKIIEVERDQNYINDLLAKEKEFWDCIIDWKSPEFTNKDFISLDDDKEALRLSKEWKKVSDSIKALEFEAEEIKSQLIAKACDKSIRVGDVRLTKITSKGAIDYKSIPVLQNVDLDKYRKAPFTKWAIR